MTDVPNNPTTNPGSGSAVQAGTEQPRRLRYRAAFQQILPEAETVAAKDLLVINIDVTTAVTTATGALPEIMALRDQASKLPAFDIKHFDTLETYALATMHVQGEYVAASRPPEELLALNDQGIALREVLHSDATALAKRGLMNGSKLSSFKVSPGYKILAEDLVGLSSLLRHNWDKIGSKTAITMAELDQAEELSDKLLSAVGAREQAPAVLAEVAIQRQRVFTLFVDAYDQVRRAINFLRWEEADLETIAPSLYSGRGNVRRKADSQPTTPPTTTTP
ncbi:MAG: hypothetical protein ABW061_09030, partial [Polyangiaceae bacterium]